MNELDESDKKALDDIKKYGCHILNVFEDGEYPNFTYSIGIEQTLEKPEIIIVGLKRELAHSVVNNYCQRLKEGEVFEPGNYYADFLDGFDVCFIEVATRHYEDHFGWARWLYKGNKFSALQMIFPTTDGIWPWDSKVSESFLWWQRILNEEGRLEKAI